MGVLIHKWKLLPLRRLSWLLVQTPSALIPGVMYLPDAAHETGSLE